MRFLPGSRRRLYRADAGPCDAWARKKGGVRNVIAELEEPQGGIRDCKRGATAAWSARTPFCQCEVSRKEGLTEMLDGEANP